MGIGVEVCLGSSGVPEGALFLLAGSARAPRAGSFLFLSMVVVVGCCSTALGDGLVDASRKVVALGGWKFMHAGGAD